MINTLVVTLGNMGETLLKACATIIGDTRGVSTFCVDWDADMDQMHAKLTEKIQSLDSGDGVLLLTDIYGGTSNNLSLACAQGERVEVVTGVNLPMLVKAMTLPKTISLPDAAQRLCEQGRDNIMVASRKGDAA